MSWVIDAQGLGKRYGRRWALNDCDLQIPSGHVVGLVGPNGAGKTTLLHLAVGLLTPTAGTVTVLGRPPAVDPAQLARVGFVAQDTPTYARLTVEDHLRFGRQMNPGWDDALARQRIAELDLDLDQTAGSLSGGQRAQLALTLAVAKRPELLILDEPVASLDPLARREFLQRLMEFVADGDVSVVLSSHLVADLERVCDYLIVLVDSRLQVAGEVDDLLASHHRLVGPRRDPESLPSGQEVIEESHTDRQSTLIVRCDGPVLDPAWTVEDLNLEDLVLAYMGNASTARRARQTAGGALVIAFSWRQFRTQAVIGGAGLVVLGIILLVTGPHLVSIYDTALAQCRASGGASSDCNNPVVSTYSKLQVLAAALVLIVPVLIGMFWGAPLIARELETGTFRLAWTQSVSRMRWLLVKLGLVGLASAAVGGLLSLMVTWWYSPIDKVNQGRFGAAAFGLHGFVPAGYALFAFALGATAGLLFRRTLPAMAVTLVGFIVARFDCGLLDQAALHDAGDEVVRHRPERGARLQRESRRQPAVHGRSTGHPQCARRFGQRRQQRRTVTLGGISAEGVPQPAGPQRTACRRPGCPGAAHRGVGERAAGVPAVHHHHFDQVPRGGHLPAAQPVLGLPDLRDAAVRRRVGSAGRPVRVVGAPAAQLNRMKLDPMSRIE